MNEPGPLSELELEEQLLRLAAVIEHFPEDQRDVLTHHHLLGTSVAGLLFRRRLAERLSEV